MALNDRLGFSLQPRAVAAARWALIAAAPAPVVLIGWWRGSTIAAASADVLIPALAASLALIGAGILLPTFTRLADALAIAGMALVGIVASPALIASPPLALLLGAVLMVAILLLFRTSRRRRLAEVCAPAEHRLHAFRGAALATTFLWILSALSRSLLGEDVFGVGGLVLSATLSVVLLLAWAVITVRSFIRERRSSARTPLHAPRLILILLGCGFVALWLHLTALTLDNVGDALVGLLILGQLALFSLDRDEAEDAGLWSLILGHPARLMVVTFAMLCAFGTLMLALPGASADGRGISLSAAAFTTVSSVCVTGLSVIDVGALLSPAGQLMQLLLIQAGGLGIMTFSTAAMRLLGRRVSLRHEGAMAQLVSPEDRSHIFAATIRLILFTFAVETLGVLCLWLAFATSGHYDTGGALWPAIYTAISAFCNAGFALTSDSLITFQHNPAVLHIVSFLVIIGGLSPLATLAAPRWFRGRPITAQARLALIVTAVMLVGGAVSFLALEWNNALHGLSVWDRIHNSWMQSVTLRTAGFASLDISHGHVVTYIVMMGLMLVGGTSGGTAGGIKTTTVGVLTLGIVATVRGKREITFERRQISHRTFVKATAAAAIFLATLGIGSFALLLTQDIPTKILLFEAVSAITTTGVSGGATPMLDEVGRVIIEGLMFVGRVGPLTLLMLLSRAIQTDEDWKRPEVDIDVT